MGIRNGPKQLIYLDEDAICVKCNKVIKAGEQAKPRKLRVGKVMYYHTACWNKLLL